MATFQQMSEEQIKAALEGRESHITDIHQENERRQEEILGATCPKCRGSLVPRIPTNPHEVFRGTKIRYQAWCPSCEEVSE